MTTAEDDNGMNLGKPVLLGELAGCIVVDDGEGQADGESSEQSGILRS